MLTELWKHSTGFQDGQRAPVERILRHRLEPASQNSPRKIRDEPHYSEIVLYAGHMFRHGLATRQPDLRTARRTDFAAAPGTCLRREPAARWLRASRYFAAAECVGTRSVKRILYHR